MSETAFDCLTLHFVTDFLLIGEIKPGRRGQRRPGALSYLPLSALHKLK
jgi:hypothetical protein